MLFNWWGLSEMLKGLPVLKCYSTILHNYHHCNIFLIKLWLYRCYIPENKILSLNRKKREHLRGFFSSSPFESYTKEKNKKKAEHVGNGKKLLWYLIIKMLFNCSALFNC